MFDWHACVRRATEWAMARSRQLHAIRSSSFNEMTRVKSVNYSRRRWRSFFKRATAVETTWMNEWRINSSWGERDSDCASHEPAWQRALNDARWAMRQPRYQFYCLHAVAHAGSGLAQLELRLLDELLILYSLIHIVQTVVVRWNRR